MWRRVDVRVAIEILGVSEIAQPEIKLLVGQNTVAIRCTNRHQSQSYRYCDVNT